MKKISINDRLFHGCNYVFFTLFSLLCIYPFYYILIYSLNGPDVSAKTLWLYPSQFTLDNYIQIFQLRGIANSFFISLARALAGTGILLFMSSMFAYVLTKSDLPLKKFMYRTMVASMYLSVGIIPWYMTMKTLGLKNNFLLYILPFVIQAYYVILIKTYIEQIGISLEESAMVDGAGYFTIFIKIILPVCKPILAAVAVFSTVGQWNYFYDNLMLVSDSKLQTIQIILFNYLSQAQAIAERIRAGENVQELSKGYHLTAQSIRMTIAVVATLPVLCFYPFLQKYFVKGIMLGAIKG